MPFIVVASSTTEIGESRRGTLVWWVLYIAILFSMVTALEETDAANEEELPSSSNTTTTTEEEEENPKLWTVHLHPTAALDVEQERRRFLQSSEDDHDNDDDDSNNRPDHYDHWFAPEQNAIYATIPDRDDPAHRHNRRLQEFHAHRHLSRYEQRYRRAQGLDWQLDWNGVYDTDDDGSDDFLATASSMEQNNSKQNSSTTTTYLSHHYHANSTSWRHQHRRSTEELLSSTTTPGGGMGTGGGQYNNYQAVPLLQGYGTHFSIVWVGTPTPQRKTVIVDTGSHYTAFPCSGCQSCGAPHHTDPYYRPEKSRTFHQLQCSECQDGVVCDDGKCKFTQAYTEGSSWEAIQVKDRFYCGGTDVLDSVDPNDQKYAIDFMFGCQVGMTWSFHYTTGGRDHGDECPPRHSAQKAL